MRRVLVPLLLSTACASAPAPDGPPAAEGQLAPFPYTAAQIRDSNPSGSAYLYALQDAAGRRTLEITRFTKSGPEAVTMEYRSWPEGAEVGAVQTGTASWEALKAHASFPAAQTTVTKETVTTPLGDIPALVYTLTTDDGVRALYFHAETAGAPWRVVLVGADGARRVERELVGRKDGEARLAWRVQVAPGAAAELDYRLARGARLEVSSSADAAVAWDVHSHAGEQVVLHQQGEGARGAFTFSPEAPGTYSVMWKNEGAAPVSLLVGVALEGEGELASSHPPWWR